MLTAQEIKKSIGFFVIMTLVLALLLSAGVSLFNFSFEMNREIINSFDDVFEFGHGVRLDGFHQNTDEWRQNGVFYARYWDSFKGVEELDDFWFVIDVIQFEDYLPTAMQRASNRYDDFLIAGQLWTSADNGVFDGRFPIFISDFVVEQANEAGVQINIGDEFNLFERRFIGFEDYIIISRTFFIQGIFRWTNLSYADHIPRAAISVTAEKEFIEERGGSIIETNFIINSLEDLRRFEREANRRGIRFDSWVLEEIALVAMFSGIFVSVSLVILLISGLIVFVYAGMIINKRIGFIGILKAMGMTNIRVAKMFFLMLLTAFSIAFLLANIFSLIINSHFSSLAYYLFGFSLGIGFNPVSQVIFAGAIVILVFLSTILLHKKIKKISVANVLTLRE